MNLFGFLAVLAVANVPQNPWPFIAVGYAVMVFALTAFAWHTLRRGKRLSRRVPPEERRWM